MLRLNKRGMFFDVLLVIFIVIGVAVLWGRISAVSNDSFEMTESMHQLNVFEVEVEAAEAFVHSSLRQRMGSLDGEVVTPCGNGVVVSTQDGKTRDCFAVYLRGIAGQLSIQDLIDRSHLSDDLSVVTYLDETHSGLVARVASVGAYRRVFFDDEVEQGAVSRQIDVAEPLPDDIAASITAAELLRDAVVGVDDEPLRRCVLRNLDDDYQQCSDDVVVAVDKGDNQAVITYTIPSAPDIRAVETVSV